MSSVVDASTLQPTKGQRVAFESTDGTTSYVDFPNVNVPANIVERNWKNQIAVQLGGSYNILPGVFSVHAGVNYETRGVDPQYMNVDFWPVQRFGLNGGITVRIDRRIDLTFAYGHIFQETLSVAAQQHVSRIDETAPGGAGPNGIDKTVGTPQDRANSGTEVAYEQNAPVSPDGTSNLEQELTATANGDPAYVINAGHYRSNLDVVAVGVQMHF
jgi:hypothetical protein